MAAQVDTISAHMCCLRHLNWCSTWSNMILAYKKTSATQFFVSTDGGYTFSMHNISLSPPQVWLLLCIFYF